MCTKLQKGRDIIVVASISRHTTTAQDVIVCQALKAGGVLCIRILFDKYKDEYNAIEGGGNSSMDLRIWLSGLAGLKVVGGKRKRGIFFFFLS